MIRSDCDKFIGRLYFSMSKISVLSSNYRLFDSENYDYSFEIHIFLVIITLMAIPVVKFSREGYKIRKVSG